MTNRTLSIFVWLVGVSFLLFQFFLQLSSGIVIQAIMKEQGLTALTAGLLSSAFYYVYTSLQIPVGLLFDRYNIRTLLALNALLCALGCFIFSQGHYLVTLFCGRLVIGAGSAFAFVGVTRILRQYFPLRDYAFMIGLSETLGFTVTVTGMIGMGSLISAISWRFFLNLAGIIGASIALLCWFSIPDSKPERTIKSSYKQQLHAMIRNRLIWMNGLFVGLEFTVITVFAALWAVPFLEIKLHCTIQIASILTALILLGAGFSCPIFGWLSIYLPRRKVLIHVSCFLTTALMLIILFYPISNIIVMGFLLFFCGLCCGAYMLAFTIANELAPPESLSACTGFTNTLAMLTAPLLQPVIGFILDYQSNHTGIYSLENYQTALLVIPAALMAASLLSQFLPDKEHCEIPRTTFEATN